MALLPKRIKGKYFAFYSFRCCWVALCFFSKFHLYLLNITFSQKVINSYRFIYKLLIFCRFNSLFRSFFTLFRKEFEQGGKGFLWLVSGCSFFVSTLINMFFDDYYQLFVRGYDDSRYQHGAQRKYSTPYRERNALIVNILFNQRTSTKEIEKIELGYLDLIKAPERGLFMHYLQNIRPKLLKYQTEESDRQFLSFPSVSYKKMDSNMV